MGARGLSKHIEAYAFFYLPSCARQRYLSVVRGKMSSMRTRCRHILPVFVAIPLLVGLVVGANMAVASPANANKVAAAYKFQGMPIAMPPGYHPTQTIRQVNPAYQHLVSWISSVGAGIAVADVT